MRSDTLQARLTKGGNVKSEPPRLAAASTIGLGLLLAAANPGLAGVSNFSVNSPATLVPGNNKQVIVTGKVMCIKGKEITVGLQLVQQGGMAAHARGEFRQTCQVSDIITWTITASSAVPIQAAASVSIQASTASVLAGAWLALPPSSGPRPTGPTEFALFNGDIDIVMPTP